MCVNLFLCYDPFFLRIRELLVIDEKNNLFYISLVVFYDFLTSAGEKWDGSEK